MMILYCSDRMCNKIQHRYHLLLGHDLKDNYSTGQNLLNNSLLQARYYSWITGHPSNTVDLDEAKQIRLDELG